ncbi:MAG: GNAT family N-acetyltransferase, partial [candidate division Zixibacteria bacterium]|nr:GNAT family N-acetyltransferase [candidate division Zixibacteria bacterium]
MKYRTYNPETDKQAVNRIWYECGWLEKDDPKPMDALLEEAAVIVADVNGEPECLAMSYLGDMDYLGERLPFSCIAGVTTSLVARRQKLAGRLTATRIALDAAAGAPVSALGMFEQGYYNRLGYGTYGYEHICCITPATLRVDVSPRVPKRLTKGDWKLMHQSRLSRLRVHGSCN